jgi:hypothetical protein
MSGSAATSLHLHFLSKIHHQITISIALQGPNGESQLLLKHGKQIPLVDATTGAVHRLLMEQFEIDGTNSWCPSSSGKEVRNHWEAMTKVELIYSITSFHKDYL